MASLTVPGGYLNFTPLAPSSGVKARGRHMVKSACGSFQSSPVARCPMAMMAMMARVVSLPVRGKDFSSIHAAKVRGLSLSQSSSSRSRIRCNAESGQDDNQQQQQPGSSSFHAESIEKRGSVAAVAEDKEKQAFQRLTEELQVRRKNFWSNFKEQHVVYKQDRDQWGLGVTPIFTVHEDEEGNRYRVDVNEDEIRLRSGVDPKMMEYAGEDCIALAEERIKLANDHARDIQLGLVKPHPLSIVYQYEREGSSSTSTVGNGPWPGESWRLSGGAPWQLMSLLIPLLSVALLGMGVKWLFSRRKHNKDPGAKNADEENLQKMQMRKLKAQARRESLKGKMEGDIHSPQSDGDSNDVINGAMIPGEDEVKSPKEVLGEVVDTGLASVNDEAFQRKVTEIQAMARQARLQEQEGAEARSAQSLERKNLLEQERKARRRAQRLENSAKDLDNVRVLRADKSDGPDPSLTVMREEVEENGQSSASEVISEGSDNYPSKQVGADSPLRSETLPSGFKPNSSKSAGAKPRIILSAEEARARIAAKRARSNASSSTGSSSEQELRRSSNGFDQSSSVSGNMETLSSTNLIEPRRSETAARSSSQESSEAISDRVLDTAAAGESSDRPPQANDVVPTEKTNNFVTRPNEPLSNAEDVNLDKQERVRDRITGDSRRERGQGKSKDEEEEMEWLRDEVLREIVFKVQANEEAGRKPFDNLNSEQETLFFKGLERKFEREGDEVKKWIKDRVENIDYGSDGISVYDPPESYKLKWKEGADRSPKTEFKNRFSQDRDRLINEKKASFFGESPADSNDESSSLSSSSPSSSPSPSSPIPPPLPVSSSYTSPPATTSAEATQVRSGEKFSRDKETKAVISSSPRIGTSPNTETGEASKENWDHTKRWAKDLERKYAMEKDHATRAMMREIGQDLERWITEDEIEAASRMLDKGVEGEEEYVRMHYERTKDKIKKQREIFGPEAMLNKYSEYKEDPEEVELWWLSLPFVVCVGLRATVEGEMQTGLYSVDVSAALDGVPGVPSVPHHTVAFQDRGDAQNFCTLVNSQPEKLGADGAEPVPFDPKELYKDAKAEGFKVTVIKKGQLKLSMDSPFEEVESQILELGSARYFDELMSDRVIDMGSVVDDGLGFGRRP